MMCVFTYFLKVNKNNELFEVKIIQSEAAFQPNIKVLFILWLGISLEGWQKNRDNVPE
jgi:hypothetical protein